MRVLDTNIRSEVNHIVVVGLVDDVALNVALGSHLSVTDDQQNQALTNDVHTSPILSGLRDFVPIVTSRLLVSVVRAIPRAKRTNPTAPSQQRHEEQH